MDMQQNLKQLMEQAQSMQQRMKDAQAAINDLTVVGKAGSGAMEVSVTMKGNHYAVSTKLSPALMDEDPEMIGGLVTAAINDAVRQIEKDSKSKIGQLTAGLNIPADFLKDKE